MTKVIKILSFLLFITSSAVYAGGNSGQAKSVSDDPSTPRFKKITLGLIVGPSFSFLGLADKDAQKEGSRMSLEYGVVADFYFAERYALSTGIIALPGGGAYSFNTTDTVPINVERCVKMRYVQIPLTLKLKTNEFGKFTPFGLVGVSPSFAVSRRWDGKVGATEVENEKANDFTNPFNFSLTAGVGTEYAVAESTRLFAGLVYNHGFMNILDDIEPVKDRASSSSFSIRLGVYF